MLCLFSLAATALGCSSAEPGTEPGAETSQQADDLTAAPATTQPVSAERRAEIDRMPKLDRAQLVALLGGNVPAAALTVCAGVDGSPCAPPVNGIVRPCGGFQGVCGNTGTQDVIPISFFCFGNSCTAVVTGPQQTIPCTVANDGTPCATGCGVEHCEAYSSSCDVETNRVQNCLSGGTCQNQQCVNQTQTVQTTGTCTRETANLPCDPGEVIPRELCKPPAAPLCTTEHICRCGFRQ